MIFILILMILQTPEQSSRWTQKFMWNQDPHWVLSAGSISEYFHICPFLNWLSENIYSLINFSICVLYHERLLFRVLNLGGKVPSYLYWCYTYTYTYIIFPHPCILYWPAFDFWLWFMIVLDFNIKIWLSSSSATSSGDTFSFVGCQLVQPRYHDNVVINYGGKATEEVKISTREDFSLSRLIQ